MTKSKNVHVLYVSLTSSYISFKIEVGKLLGKVNNNNLPNGDYYAVEHIDDEVNYVQLEDIYKTENEAMKGLVKILNNKLEKDDK